MHKNAYDITIIGTALVGASLALALKDTSLQILLIDAEATPPLHDKRLIALTHASCNVFKNLDLWPALLPHACAIQEIHVSNRGHFGSARITAKEAGLHTLGHVVPAKEINAGLFQKLSDIKNLTLLRPAKLTALVQQPDDVTLTLDTDTGIKTVTSKIVIGCDGTQSTVRKLLAIDTDEFDYQQRALVTQTELQRDHRHIAYERFLPTGAIAMLPLAERKVATIWTDKTETINKLLAMNDAEFLQALQTQFGFRLGKLTRTLDRAFYPLKFVKAKKQHDHRVLLIGNAAHTVHPVAAQGLNLALYEIAVLADALRSQSSDTLKLPDLQHYFQQQNISLNLSHRLTQLFSADFVVTKAARQAGLVGFDLCPALKKQFIKRTTGHSSFVPALFLRD